MFHESTSLSCLTHACIFHSHVSHKHTIKKKFDKNAVYLSSQWQACKSNFRNKKLRKADMKNLIKWAMNWWLRKEQAFAVIFFLYQGRIKIMEVKWTVEEAYDMLSDTQRLCKKCSPISLSMFVWYANVFFYNMSNVLRPKCSKNFPE